MVEAPALNTSRTHFGFTSQSAELPVEAFASTVDTFSAVQVSRADLPKVTIGKTESWVEAADGRASKDC
jgi:hypothetical protein